MKFILALNIGGFDFLVTVHPEKNIFRAFFVSAPKGLVRVPESDKPDNSQDEPLTADVWDRCTRRSDTCTGTSYPKGLHKQGWLN
jgi:hypothetical protein